MIYSFQYFRIIALVLVVVEHLSILSPHNHLLMLLASGGAIATSFFFMLSGFFQYKHLQKVNSSSFTQHFKNTIHYKKSYFLQYYFYLVLAFLYYQIINKNLLSNIINVLKDILLIPVLVRTNDYIGSSAWFFMVLIICMIFSYYLKKLVDLNNHYFLTISCLIILFFIAEIFCSTFFIDYYEWFMWYSVYPAIVKYTIGLLLGKLYFNQLSSLKFASIHEIISILLIVGIKFGYVNLFSFHFSILVCTIYLIYVYSFQKGCISKLLKPNVIIDYIYQLSFPIYLFHFILLKIISLSPKLSPWNNIYINFIEVLVIINIGYYIVRNI